jgi:ornithine cyclodeaminase/alanine dehydrogenase-like protein (mu-crystallin family)
MEGGVITELRTAACSAVATQLLARPDASVLAILGSGAQARAHWHVLSWLQPWREVRVWSRTQAHAQELVREIGPRAKVAADVKSAVSGADVIVTATSATGVC